MDLGCLLGGEAGGQDKGKASTLHSLSWEAPIRSSSVRGAGQTRGTGDPGDGDLVASSCQAGEEEAGPSQHGTSPGPASRRPRMPKGNSPTADLSKNNSAGCHL